MEEKKVEVLDMLEERPELVELLEVVRALPAGKREKAIKMALEVLRGSEDGLGTVVRLWPSLSPYWHDNLVEDAKEGIRDGQRERELARKYKKKVEA